MNKRYYKKLNRIQQNKQNQQASQQNQSNFDDSTSYSRSRSNNIFQLQKFHDSNLELVDAQDQGGGAAFVYKGNFKQQGEDSQSNKNYANIMNRDCDIFRYNSLSQGPMSTNDSPSKDFMDFSSTKNDIISNNMQTSINSTVRSSMIFPQSFLKKINSLENITINSNGYTLEQYQEAVNMLQKAIKQGEYDEIKQIFEVNQKQLSIVKEDVILQNNLNLLYDVSITGWNCIHCCCFYCDWEEPIQRNIFQFIFSKVNQFQDIITKDDYTALQLAVYKDQIEIVKYLIQKVLVDINLITIRGSAFHIACKKGFKNIVRYFLTKTSINQDQRKLIIQIFNRLKDENDQIALDSALPQIQEFINQNKKYFKKINSKEKSKESFLQGIPEKPAMIRGKVQRHILTFMMSDKILEINPDICSLIFYDNEKDIPKKPGDIYPIKDIDKIEPYKPSFFMKKNYSYIKIFYVDEIIIGFKNKSTQTLWLHQLKKAMEYCKFVENKIKNYVHEQNFIKLERSFLLISVVEDDDHVLTLEDKERPSDQFQNNKKTEPFTSSNKQIRKDNSPKRSTESISKSIIFKGHQKQNNLFNLDNIEESKNEDMVSNKSKFSYLQKSSLDESEKIKLSSFDILDIIGSGAFGRVFLAQKKNNKQIFYALKSLKKHQLLNKNYLKYAQTELNILKSCKNPFIIGLHASFQTQNYIYMALDYCPGGDLGLILAQKNGMKEKTIKFIIAQVVLAIEYLHNMKVVYRDLKPENILLDKGGYIKLADFGLSRENVLENEICKSFCGSPAYISPEQLLKIGATKKTDIYGIGCIMYEMYSGNPPFYDQDMQVLFENIKNQQLVFNENFSPLCIDLLQKMLDKDYDKRPTIQEVKAHPYFKKMDWDQLYNMKISVPEEIMECIDLNGPIQNNFNYQNVTIFKDAEYDQNNTNQKYKIENWSFTQLHDIYV